MTKSTKTVVIRFTDQVTQPSKIDESGALMKRVVGYVPAKNMLDLLDDLDLDANPRSSKVGNVTKDIMETLSDSVSRDMFHFMTKGVLLGCARYKELDRNRFKLWFEDTTTEGLLDGGHNMLAIGLHILSSCTDGEAQLKGVKFWSDMKRQWHKHRDDIDLDEDALDFLVPVELLVPSAGDDGTKDKFLGSLLDVCAARNNNAQLVDEAKANKRGYFEAMKDALGPEFSQRVEWKPNAWDDENEKKPIKVKDLVAFSWLPLNVLKAAGALPENIGVVLPNTIYSSKGECLAKFNKLMERGDICTDEGAKSVLHHQGVESAFKRLANLPELYDDLYEQFIDAYNDNGKFRLGANPLVKIHDPTGEKRKALMADGRKEEARKYVSKKPVTPMHRRSTKYSYPDGWIAPLFYGLTSLMTVDEKGRVVWAVKDPRKFLKKHLKKIASRYRMVLKVQHFDPQKIAKEPESYEFCVEQFEMALAAENMKNAAA